MKPEDSHYRQGGIEPSDLIMSNDLPTWKGNVIEYIFRAGKKPLEGSGNPLRDGEFRDIQAAVFWLNKRLEYLGGPQFVLMNTNENPFDPPTDATPNEDPSRVSSYDPFANRGAQ